jgi:hypothetical protein
MPGSRKFWILLIIILGIFLRFYNLNSSVTFFADQAWFLLSARDSVLSGHLPLLGITSSITWLHQGPLWTYFLIPLLLFFKFTPLAPGYFTAFLGTITIPITYYLGALLFNRRTGFLSALIFAVSNIVVIQNRIAYHTSLIPTLTVIFLLLLLKRRLFLAGLFLGLVYQLHLLSLVFWLPVFYYLYRRDYPFAKFITGLSLGILPFLLSGPVQAFGVVFWFLKFFWGSVTTSGLSTAYLAVFVLPFILIVSRLFSRLPTKILIFIVIAFAITNICLLLVHDFYSASDLTGPNLGRQIVLARAGTLQVTAVPRGVTTTGLPLEYLTWWLSGRVLK